MSASTPSAPPPSLLHSIVNAINLMAAKITAVCSQHADRIIQAFVLLSAAYTAIYYVYQASIYLSLAGIFSLAQYAYTNTVATDNADASITQPRPPLILAAVLPLVAQHPILVNTFNCMSHYSLLRITAAFARLLMYAPITFFAVDLLQESYTQQSLHCRITKLFPNLQLSSIPALQNPISALDSEQRFIAQVGISAAAVPWLQHTLQCLTTALTMTSLRLNPIAEYLLTLTAGMGGALCLVSLTPAAKPAYNLLQHTQDYVSSLVTAVQKNPKSFVRNASKRAVSFCYQLYQRLHRCIDALLQSSDAKHIALPFLPPLRSFMFTRPSPSPEAKQLQNTAPPLRAQDPIASALCELGHQLGLRGIPT